MFESIGYFERATAKDPTFAPAYAAFAAVYALRSNQSMLDHHAGEVARLRAAAGKAGAAIVPEGCLCVGEFAGARGKATSPGVPSFSAPASPAAAGRPFVE